MSIVETFLSTISKHSLIERKDRILVGLSGGGDSRCLLEFLSLIRGEYNLRLGLAHINYGLRASESDGDEDFVRCLGRDYGLPVFIKRESIVSISNIQARARQIRFLFFKEVMFRESYGKLALGHNLDDLIEGFFLRLGKGSLLGGLISFSYSNDLDGISIIRPLLDISKDEIIEYLGERSYRTDSSNLEIKYSRNELRLKVLPALEGIFPGYRKSIAKTIGHLRADNLYIENRVADTVRALTQESTGSELKLDLVSFNAFSLDLKKRVLSMCVRMMGEMVLSQKALLDIVGKLNNFACRGSFLLFRRGNFVISGEYSFLVFRLEDVFSRVVLPISLFAGRFYNISSSYGLRIDDIRLTALRFRVFTRYFSRSTFILMDKSKLKSLSVRSLMEGDRIYFNDKVGYKKVKELLIDNKVSRFKRKGVLILLDSNEPIGILSPYLSRLSESYYISSSSIIGTRVSLEAI